MKNFLPTLFLLLSFYPAFSQYEQVVFDYESSQFNNGQPLPSEEFFVFTGQVSPDVDMVEAVIARRGLIKNDDKPIFTGRWVRDYDNRSNDWQIPVNYKLKQNEEYDVMIRYFTSLGEGERRELGYTLKEQLLNYLDQEIIIEEKEVELRDAPGKVYQNLNEILRQSTGNLRNRLESDAPAFSDIVKEGIQKLDDLDLKDADELLGGDSLGTEGEKRYQFARQQINTVKRQIINETDQMFFGSLSILTSRKVIRNYTTEKKRNHINVLIGYGTVYDDNLADEDFGSGWYGGVSIPLGHTAHSSKIWSNTAISVGVFFQDLEFDDGAYTYSGPVVDRPSFVAVGYKVFNFLRLQAGAAFLQLESDDSGLLDVSDVEIRPYVGLSAELKLWIGTND